MKSKIKENALTKTGKLNHHFINKLTNDEITEIIKLTDFSPINTPVQIRVKFILDDIKEYPKCIICGKPVRPHFKNLYLLDTCSKDCDYKLRAIKTKESNLDNYGVQSTNQLDPIKIKQKKSMVENHGVEFYTQTNEFTKKSEKTKLEKYNNPKYVNPEKGKQTKLEKYGNENYNNHEKFIQTCIKKYGVEHVMQNKEIFEKQQSKCYGAKKYKHLYYRGTYELLFIKEFEKRYNINDLDNCFPIKYEFNNEIKIYFPDFLIKSKNTIIEIKSDWTYDNCGKNNLLREVNEKKWEAAKSLTDYSFIPLKSKNEIKLFFRVFGK